MAPLKPILGKTAFILYLSVLVASPLFYGAVQTHVLTAITAVVLIVSIGVMAHQVSKDRDGKHWVLKLPKTGVGVGLLLMFGFLVIQMVPMPSAVINRLSPEAALVASKAYPAVAAATTGGHDGILWSSLAPYRFPVRLSAVRLAVYGLFFVGLVCTLTTRKRIEIAILLVLLLGCFQVLYGFFEATTGVRPAQSYRKGFTWGLLSGTYVNRNHFAGWLEMAMVLVTTYAVALSPVRTPGGGISDFPTASKWHRKSLPLVPHVGKRALAVFAAGIMGLGIVFSGSRAGMLGTAMALAALFAGYMVKQNHRHLGRIVLILVLVAGGYAVQLDIERPLGRFKDVSRSLETRNRLAEKTLEMMDAYRWTGVGVGNFHYAYPKYQAFEDRRAYVRFAHNDWAQFAAEAGIVGLGILCVTAAAYLYRMFRLWRLRSDGFASSLGLAGPAAMLAIAVHSFFDFNLHVPANALMLAAVAAVSFCALRQHKGRQGYRTHFHCVALPLRGSGSLLLLVILAICLWTGKTAWSHFIAERSCRSVNRSAVYWNPEQSVDDIRAAIAVNPANAAYGYRLAMGLRQQRDGWARLEANEPGTAQMPSDPETKRQEQMEILKALETAIRLNPLESDYHVRLGWEYTYLWRLPDGRERWQPAADLCMERAAFFAGDSDNPYLHIETGDYWVMRSRTVGRNHPRWDMFWRKAVWHYHKNLSLEPPDIRPRRIAHIEANLRVHYPDDSDDDLRREATAWDSGG